MTGGRDGWPETETVLTTSEYGALLQKGQLLSLTHTRTNTHKQTRSQSHTLYLFFFCRAHAHTYTTVSGQEKYKYSESVRFSPSAVTFKVEFIEAPKCI